MSESTSPWPKPPEGAPSEPHYERVLREVSAEIGTVTDEEVAAAEKDLIEQPFGVTEFGVCPPDLQKVYAYIQRLNDQYGFDEQVPLSVRSKRQIAYFLSYDQLETVFPMGDADGQVFVCRGWKVVYVPTGDDSLLTARPAGRA